jgi:hypothetical protein
VAVDVDLDLDLAVDLDLDLDFDRGESACARLLRHGRRRGKPMEWRVEGEVLS